MERIHYSRKEYREEYLRSEEWRLLSAAILLRDPICRLCEENPSKDAHHLTYERIHHERPDDLIGICRTCHNFIHRYPELSRIKILEKLKQAFKRAKEPWILNRGFFKALDHRSDGIRWKVATILNIHPDKFRDIDKLELSFSKHRRVRNVTNKFRSKRKPRKSRNWTDRGTPKRVIVI